MSALENFLKQHTDVKKGSEVPTGSRIMNFGKYRGKTWDWIYDTDLPYIAFAMKGDRKYWAKQQDYWRSRIEEDYGEQKD